MGLGDEMELDGEIVMPYCEVKDGVLQSEKPVSYFKTDGDKVYMRGAEPQFTNWYLLYDFGLEVGEGTYISTPRFSKTEEHAYTRYLYCTEKGIYNEGEDGEWEYMTLEVYENENLESENKNYTNSGIWIVGVGHLQIVDISNMFNWDGVCTHINEVKLHDKIIYRNEDYKDTSNISEMSFDEKNKDVISSSSDIYTLQGTKVKLNGENLPTGLYLINGKKVLIK